MVKKFIDDGLFKKKWFRELSTDHKLFFIYISTNCNHAGIWEVEIDIANLRLGINISEEECLNYLKGRIYVFDNGTKWFLIAYPRFQYGELKDTNNLHRSVLSILKKYNLYKIYTNDVKKNIQGLVSPSLEDKDKDKDKDKDINNKINVYNTKENFEQIWKKYQNKVGKQKAFEKFKKSVKTEQDWNNINKSLDNYTAYLKIENWRKWQDGKTWFNNWRDWLEYQEPTVPQQPTPQDEKKKEIDEQKQRINKLFSGVVDTKKISEHILDKPQDEEKINIRLKDKYSGLVRSVANYVKKERDKFSKEIASLTANIGKSIPPDNTIKTSQQALNEFYEQTKGEAM